MVICLIRLITPAATQYWVLPLRYDRLLEGAVYKRLLTTALPIWPSKMHNVLQSTMKQQKTHSAAAPECSIGSRECGTRDSWMNYD